MVRNRLLIGLGLTGIAVALSACTQSPVETRSLPDCPGSAASDYGLGNAIHAAAGDLAVLPGKLSTGAATATAQIDGGGIEVKIRVCSDGLGVDDFKDAATSLSIAVADEPGLGAEVSVVSVENYSTRQVVENRPFQYQSFVSVGDPDEVRNLWSLVTS